MTNFPLDNEIARSTIRSPSLSIEIISPREDNSSNDEGWICVIRLIQSERRHEDTRTECISACSSNIRFHTAPIYFARAAGKERGGGGLKGLADSHRYFMGNICAYIVSDIDWKNSVTKLWNARDKLTQFASDLTPYLSLLSNERWKRNLRWLNNFVRTSSLTFEFGEMSKKLSFDMDFFLICSKFTQCCRFHSSMTV